MMPSRGLCLGTCAFGRALDAAGTPLDGGPPLRGRRVSLELHSPRPNERVAIGEPLWTGVRVVDALLTIGRGARVGIFGAPGAGKTTLLESLVDGCVADAVVVALAGERGREAQHWIARCDERTTVVCATSDRPARERLVAAHVAIAHAQALRERGLDVLLVLDSLARVAAASREITVASGESAGRGGYPPSVFAELARLVEVAGAVSGGSITLIATVLSDGDDRDPVSEAARSLLDGHIALSVGLAQAGRFPSVDVLNSTSRTMDVVASDAHLRDARKMRHMLSLLDRIKDARSLGIEPVDSSARAAIAIEGQIESFLRQSRQRCDHVATLSQLARLAEVVEFENGDR
ncbi:MAG TPA: EscN/YscN/HrcN family type III secretion system ATPase [Candidatus Cybelea sp.]|nr:EscN/YscN/HrcN family type III secretion system ATPase [Candidatus Cybelea sp.]